MIVKTMSPLRGFGVLCARRDRARWRAHTARKCRPSGASLSEVSCWFSGRQKGPARQAGPTCRAFAVLGVLAGLVFTSGCGERASPFGEGESAEAEDTRARVVTQAMLHPWPRTIRAQGSLVEDEQAQLGVKV